MQIEIKPSDMQYKYPKNHANRSQPKFSGLPDDNLFDRDDLYEVIPMFQCVMSALNVNDAAILYRMEELTDGMPRFLQTRRDVYLYLGETLGDILGIEFKA
ncbi:MAG: hypothetical protein RBR22_07540 [Desulfuromonas sp.]|nr:hypothetical protein [Desulfuromonas sp.]